MTEDSDPDHLDPAGKVADLVESGDVEIDLADELREFIDTVESSDDPVDPGTVATVRIARARYWSKQMISKEPSNIAAF